MQSTIIKNENVDYLDEILLKQGQLQVVPMLVLAAVPQLHLSIWGNKNGVYCFPTTELIDWLKDQIDGRSAIEICSGTGVIGRALGIPRTDSYFQTRPEIVAYYAIYGQKPIYPPDDVLKFEANEAVDHFKPAVVLGSYITQKHVDGDELATPKIGSSHYGIDELSLLPKVETYIAVGNKSTHGDKRILKFPHTTYNFPWIYTRSVKPEFNEITIWNKNDKTN